MKQIIMNDWKDTYHTGFGNIEIFNFGIYFHKNRLDDLHLTLLGVTFMLERAKK